MNDDLISRQAVTDLIMENDPWWCEGMTRIIFDCINRLPSVDAVPVRHGKWLKIHPQGIYECSECHQNVMTSDIDCYKFCHQCGARMDKE